MPHYHRNDRDEFIDHLANKYPACFFVDPAQRRPLKTNIIDDLEKDRVLDRERLAQTLDWYQSHFSYQYSLVAGNERIDLGGKRAGVVTPAEQREAQRRIAARKRELKERSTPVIANKPNGATHVITKATPLHPALPRLTELTNAANVVRTLLVETQFEAMRATLVRAALQDVIAKAELLIAEVGDN